MKKAEEMYEAVRTLAVAYASMISTYDERDRKIMLHDLVSASKDPFVLSFLAPIISRPEMYFQKERKKAPVIRLITGGCR